LIVRGPGPASSTADTSPAAGCASIPLRTAVFIALAASWQPAAVAVGNWNCERSTDDKQWECVAKKKDEGAETPAEPEPKAPPARPIAARAAALPESRRAPAPPSPPAEIAPVAKSGPGAVPPPLRPAEPAPPAEMAARSVDEEEDDDEEGESAETEKAMPAAAPEVAADESAGEPDGAPPARAPRPETPLAASRFVPLGTVSVRQEAASPQSVAANAPSAPAGWTCRPQKESRSWDCNLVGPDPRGVARPVGAAGEPPEDWAQATTITEYDEQRFDRLLGMMPGNPWAGTCVRGKRESDAAKDFLLSSKDRLARKRAPVEVHGDYGEMDDQEVATFTGSAEVTRYDQHVKGDFLSLNTEADTVNARGSVFYREKGLASSSDTAFLRMEDDKGVLRNSQFIVETMPSRGVARVAHMDSDTRSRYETATYTTCPPGNTDWMLHADEVTIDKETGRGDATHAWMEFKGVPMFYTPYMDFPVDDRRQSGFLSPTFGQSKVNGFNLSVPYYFNLAPDYDLTVQAREMTSRGPLFGGDFRWLTEHQRIRLLGEIIPEDSQTKTTRGQAGFDAMGRWTDNLFTLVDLNYVSDSQYLNQLNNTLGLMSNTFVQSQAYADYTYSNGSVRLLTDYYQNVDPSIPAEQTPYYRLPSLRGNYGAQIGDSGFRFQANAEAVNFGHGGSTVKGQRLNVQPQISYPIQSPGSFLIPSVAVQNTTYMLQDQAAGTDSSLNRVAPIFSVDSGLVFDRDFELGSASLRQTLEPRVFYTYVPKINQNDYPIFDSNYYDFTYYQLFRTNRFAGADRLADMNQVTVALTSRFIDQETGWERLTASLGKVFFITDPSVTLVNPYGTNPLGVVLGPDQGQFTYDNYNKSYANVIGKVGTRLTETFSLGGETQISPYTGRFERGSAGLQYNDRQNNLLNLSYRYRVPLPNQPAIEQTATIGQNTTALNNTDVSFRIPFLKDWHLIGRWQYSLLYNRTLESLVGLEHETCCWRFTVLGREYLNGVNQSNDPTTNTAIFVQMELKGLTRLGDQVDRFLYRTINGYRMPNDDF
jgi:LPS-assembly protein